MYECNHCDFETDNEKGLKIHTSQQHKSSQKKEYQCENCSETFVDYPSRREGRGRKSFYCSRDCKDFDEKVEKVDSECSWCGTSLQKYPSSAHRMGDYSIDNHFCDKECESNWKQDHWVGEDHPSYDGGHETYYGENWNESRRNALSDAGYTCELCETTRADHYEQYGFDLDVHHRVPVRAFGDPSDANFDDNLVVTCRDCHQSTLESEPIPHNDLRSPA